MVYIFSYKDGIEKEHIFHCLVIMHSFRNRQSIGKTEGQRKKTILKANINN